jgi:predicted porin
MGNTGGDNRVEFGTRLDHAVWYETPTWGGFAFAALFSPGQNRAMNSDNIAAGESDCTGGNIPGSGGITPTTCSDGSFNDALSSSLTYSKGPLYIVAAYERHKRVNRSSDITGIYASGNDYSQTLAAHDVADEDAGKIGMQYVLPTKTTVSGIWETMHRYVPAELQFQNERQRRGTWFALSQQLTKQTSLHLGWAHAFRAPGDPGQHNDSVNPVPGGDPTQDFTAGAHADNRANLYTAALKYQFTRTIGVYADWALTANGPAAHYDLGAGGRGITTDCHDAFAAAGGMVASNPHCWTGTRLMGFSLGILWRY